MNTGRYQLRWCRLCTALSRHQYWNHGLYIRSSHVSISKFFQKLKKICFENLENLTTSHLPSLHREYQFEN